MNRPALGMYAPLPGSASGIAEYAATSSAMLATEMDVRLVSMENYTSPLSFDHVLYHMGGGRDSVAVFRAAAERPGPIILHEHVLSQFFVENHNLLDGATNRVVRDAFSSALGQRFDDSAELAQLMERERHLHYLDLGLERLLFDRATVVFTHSRAALTTLAQRYGHERIRPIEFVAQPLPRHQRNRTRGNLGVPATATLFGSFGFVGRHKRLPELLAAWDNLHVAPDTGRLLVAGAGASKLCPPDHPSITVMEYVKSGNRFRCLLAAVDAGVQLRGPSLGETSAVIAQLLASDVPVITSTESVLPVWASRELVRIVPPGPSEVDELAAALAGYLHSLPAGRGRLHDAPVPSWRESVLLELGIETNQGRAGRR
jgi:hypothetical protein